MRTPPFRAKARAVLNPGARGGKRPASSSDFGVVDDRTELNHLHVRRDLTVDGCINGKRADRSEWVEALDPEEAIEPGMVVGWHCAPGGGQGVSLRTAGAVVSAAPCVHLRVCPPHESQASCPSRVSAPGCCMRLVLCVMDGCRCRRGAW